MPKVVYAGSFDPPTVGHLWVIEQTARVFTEVTVAVAINPNKRYQFDETTRLQMLRQMTAHLPNLEVISIGNGYLINYAKRLGADCLVRGIRNGKDFEDEQLMLDFNLDHEPDITTWFLMPPRQLRGVSSSFVKGLVGPLEWQYVVTPLVSDYVYQQLLVQRFWEIWNRWVSHSQLDQSIMRDVGQTLVADYQQTGRFYHTLTHIVFMMEHLEEYGQEAQQPLALFLAVAMHDWVYDPKATDNEARSADQAEQALQSAGAKVQLIELVKDLIMATQSHQAKTPDQQLLIDLDLLVFGLKPAHFQLYSRQQIRQEYSHINEAVYRSERAKILGKFLSRPSIYGTPYLEQAYGPQARANLEQEQAWLLTTT